MGRLVTSFWILVSPFGSFTFRARFLLQNYHSYRNATIGLTLVARRAGK